MASRQRPRCFPSQIVMALELLLAQGGLEPSHAVFLSRAEYEKKRDMPRVPRFVKRIFEMGGLITSADFRLFSWSVCTPSDALRQSNSYSLLRGLRPQGAE